MDNIITSYEIKIGDVTIDHKCQKCKEGDHCDQESFLHLWNDVYGKSASIPPYWSTNSDDLTKS